MNIGYIGRQEVYEELIQKEIIKRLDIHYTSLRDTYYSLNEEIIKLYKVKGLDLVLIDYCPLENDEEALRILKSAKAVQQQITIKLVLRERKFYADAFETIALHQENKVLEKPVESKTMPAAPIEEKRKNKKTKKEWGIASVKLPEMPKVSLPKLTMPSIELPSLKEIGKKKNQRTEKENRCNQQPARQQPSISFDLRHPVSIFYSAFDLQGTSQIVASCKKKHSKTAVIDTDLSFVKYTKYRFMTDYIDHTLVDLKNLTIQEEGIYTFITENPLELIQLIDFLKAHYDFIVIDTKKETLIKQMGPMPSYDSYFVASTKYEYLTTLQNYVKGCQEVLLINSMQLNAQDIQQVSLTLPYQVLEVNNENF